MELTVKSSARLLRVSEKTVYRWISAGKIPYHRVGNQYRFDRNELATWAAESGRPLDATQVHESEPADELPALSEALCAGGIYYRVDARTPLAAIEEITSIMRFPDASVRGGLTEALGARERLASTGIGKGVAIAHMRYALEDLSNSQVTLAFPEAPIDWSAVDGEPVSIIFVPLCNSMRAHLHVLSQLNYVLNHTRWRKLLDRRASRKEILEGLAAVEPAAAEG